MLKLQPPKKTLPGSPGGSSDGRLVPRRGVALELLLDNLKNLGEGEVLGLAVQPELLLLDALPLDEESMASGNRRGGEEKERPMGKRRTIIACSPVTTFHPASCAIWARSVQG